ncbi:hypothetical protein SDC49_19135 [Lactobacillus sp. R2/2]|nr:hypothetical protein [Lactobacillus sp. R2/2]
MKKIKSIKKLLIVGVMLSVGSAALVGLNSQPVAAKPLPPLPVATTKDFNKLQKLSKNLVLIILKQESGMPALFLAIMLKHIAILNHIKGQELSLTQELMTGIFL